MDADKKLETMEEQIKLMKGELKQSLASVRDYLLNMELPSSEFSTILAALGDGGDQKMTMKASFGDQPKKPKEEKEETPVEESAEEPNEESPETDADLSPEDSQAGPEESPEGDAEMPPGDEMPGDEEHPEDEAEPTEESPEPESELPAEEEPQMAYEKINAEVSPSTPKVNLMANLINWVAKAKKDIGYEKMPTFLEVYGICGHLSPELKETILHLAEITSEQPEDASTAELWSQSMLALHGILTGGEAPLYPVRPAWNVDETEIEPGEDKAGGEEANKPKDMPLKIKLVFPNGNGQAKEYCIDLTPDGNTSEA